MSKTRLKIGILNLMHDKEDTQNRYQKIFNSIRDDISLSFYYPKMHYQNRPVPKKVAQISQALDINEIKNFDGFIITGAPIEHFKFNEITYIEELRCLLNELDKNRTQQLYFCWGAMIALNHFYGIHKVMLPEKLFGIYPHKIFYQDDLLKNIPNGFLAPHARYAEMNHEEIARDARLILDAETDNGALFSVSAIDKPEQNFIFSHLEYDKAALANEYEREITAHPEKTYKKPENYSLTNPIFNWKNTQQEFFKNWLNKVDQAKKNKAALAL